jgi:hypothetical protein
MIFKGISESVPNPKTLMYNKKRMMDIGHADFLHRVKVQTGNVQV